MNKKIFNIILSLVLSIIIYRYLDITGYFLFVLIIFFYLSFYRFKDKSILIGSSLLLVSLLINSTPIIELEIGERLYLEGEVIRAFNKKENYQRIEVKDKSGVNFSIGTVNTKNFNQYDIVKGNIEIKDKNFSGNYFLYNQENYYYLNNISANANSNELDIYKNSSPIKNIKNEIISFWSNSIDTHLDEINAGIVRKLVLSDSSNIDEEIEDNYRQTGLSHLLAISGLHIFLIIGFLDIIFKLLRMNYNFRFIIITVVLLFYSYILNFPASINRALLMYFLVTFFNIRKIKISNLSVVLLSAILLLTINYKSLFDLGFQLSFGSVLGIILLKDKLFMNSKSKLISSLGTYLSVNIGIFPILVIYFNNINIFSFISNLFITPLIMIVLIMSYISLIIDLFMNPQIFYIIINLLLDFSNFYLDKFIEIFNYKIQVPFPNLGFLGIYYFVLFSIFTNSLKMFLYKYKRELGIIFSFVGILIIKDIASFPLYLGFYDVGQGDSCYILYKDNYIQIDTGGSVFSSFNPGKEITTKTIKNRGINNVDLLILSHFDKDHIMGTEHLINENLVNHILTNPPENNNDVYQELSNLEANIYFPNNQENITIDKDLNIRLLNVNPPKFLSSNDSSLVLLVEYKDYKCLFTGDISSDVERNLLKSIGKIDILKVSHHGSNTSSDLEFLNKTRPDYSVISVGKNNSYGHPTEEVLNNLSKINSNILRTDESGEIIFKLDSNITYKTFKNSNIQIDYLYLGFSAIISYMFVNYVKKNEELNEIQRL